MKKEKIRIGAIKLPKMGGKKKELWQPRCQKLGEKFKSNLGNEVAKNEGGGGDLGQKLKGEKMWQLICGNGVAENWRKREEERERVHTFLF